MESMMKLLLPALLLVFPLVASGQDFVITPSPGYPSPQAGPQAGPQGKIIYMFTSNGCAPCKRWFAQEAPKLAKRGFIFGEMGKVNVAIVDVDLYKEFSDHYKVTATPTFLIIENGKETVRHDKAVSAETLALAYLGQPKRQSVPHYGGTDWSWPGDLAHHLRTTHGKDVSGLSQQEMRRLHNNLHNGYQK